MIVVDAPVFLSSNTQDFIEVCDRDRLEDT